MLASGWLALNPQEAATQPADSAQPTAPAEAAAPAPLSPAEAAAKQQYIDGDRRYAEGRYEESVRHFEAAYKLSKRPALLYNLANAYERMGDYAAAYDRLERYLETETPKGAPAMRQRLVQLALRAAKKKLLDDELLQLRSRPACPTCAVPPPSKSAPRLAYALVGTGAVALATAAVFGVVARGAHNDAAKSCVQTDGNYCSTSARSALDREKRFALLTDTAAVVGIAAVTTGAYLLWRRRSSETKRRRTVAAPIMVPGGIGVGLATIF